MIRFAIFEVSWGPLDKSQGYVQHIVGAYHFDTDWIENGPIWNLSSPDVIEQNLLKWYHSLIKQSFYIPIIS